MRHLSLAVVILVAAIALAVLTPRLVAGGAAGKTPTATACISVNFSRDCATGEEFPLGIAGPYVTPRPSR